MFVMKKFNLTLHFYSLLKDLWSEGMEISIWDN